MPYIVLTKIAHDETDDTWQTPVIINSDHIVEIEDLPPEGCTMHLTGGRQILIDATIQQLAEILGAT